MKNDPQTSLNASVEKLLDLRTEHERLRLDQTEVRRLRQSTAEELRTLALRSVKPSADVAAEVEATTARKQEETRLHNTLELLRERGDAITEKIGVDKQKAVYQGWASKSGAYPQ